MVEIDDLPGGQPETVARKQVGEGEFTSVQGVAVGSHGGDAFGCDRTTCLVECDEYSCLLVALADSGDPIGQRSVRQGEPLVGLSAGHSDDPLETVRIAVGGVERSARKDVGAAEKGGAGRAALHE